MTTMEALDAELRSLEDQVLRLDGARRRAHALGAQAADLEREVASIAGVAALEAADVKRVEEGGFIVFLECLFEARDDRLARERAEAMKAHLELQSRRETLARVVAAWERWRAEADTLRGAEAALSTVRQQKRALLVELGHPSVARLEALAAELRLARAMDVELGEAVAAGVVALEALDGLVAALQKAKGAAQADVFMKGGMLLNMHKRTLLQRADRASRAAREALEAFDREAADLGKVVSASMDAISYNPLMDMVFDNIFTDWSVMKRVGASLSSARKTREAVRLRHDEIEASRQRNATLLVQLQAEEAKLLSPE